MSKYCGKTKTVHKTVRFTQEQVDLINSQGQDSSTANLDHLLGEFLHQGVQPAQSFSQTKKVPQPAFTANPRTFDALPGARTLDILIRKKEVWTCFLCHNLYLYRFDRTRCGSVCGTTYLYI